MRILLPDPRRTRKGKPKARAARLVPLAGALVAVGVAGYLWPAATPQDLYGSVDPQVAGSLSQFRSDHDVRRLDVGGTIWTYYAVGAGPETLVFLHGTEDGGDAWWQQINALDDRTRIISINFPAFESVEEAVVGARAVIDDQNVDHVHVIGSGLGGLVAHELAAGSPDRVRSVVLVNPFVPSPELRQWASSRRRSVAVLPQWMRRRSELKRIEQTLYPASGGSALVRDYLTERALHVERTVRLSWLRALDVDRSLSGPLRQPTLLITTSNDPIGGSPEGGRGEAFAGARVSDLGDAGHVPHLNRPAQLTRLLEGFLELPEPVPSAEDETDTAPEGS